MYEPPLRHRGVLRVPAIHRQPDKGLAAAEAVRRAALEAALAAAAGRPVKVGDAIAFAESRNAAANFFNNAGKFAEVCG